MTDPTEAIQEISDEVILEGDRKPIPLLGSGQAGGPLGDPQGAFTYRHLWGDVRGHFKPNLQWDVVRHDSRVFAAASETKPQDVSSGGRVGEPVLGAARVTVHNVAAHDGGVAVWVEVVWDSPLPLAISYLVIP